MNSRPGPCLRSPQGPPGGAALNRSSPGGCFPTVLEYSEPRRLPSAQESKSLCGWAGVRAPRRGAGGDSGARPPVLARERARPRELARRGVHFYPSAAKNSPRAPSGARNSGPQIRQDDSALPGSGRGRQRGGGARGVGPGSAGPLRVAAAGRPAPAVPALPPTATPTRISRTVTSLESVPLAPPFPAVPCLPVPHASVSPLFFTPTVIQLPLPYPSLILNPAALPQVPR